MNTCNCFADYGGVAKIRISWTKCCKALALSQIANTSTYCTLDINKHIGGTLMREVRVQEMSARTKALAYEPDEKSWYLMHVPPYFIAQIKGHVITRVKHTRKAEMQCLETFIHTKLISNGL